MDKARALPHSSRTLRPAPLRKSQHRRAACPSCITKHLSALKRVRHGRDAAVTMTRCVPYDDLRNAVERDTRTRCALGILRTMSERRRRERANVISRRVVSYREAQALHGQLAYRPVQDDAVELIHLHKDCSRARCDMRIGPNSQG